MTIGYRNTVWRRKQWNFTSENAFVVIVVFVQYLLIVWQKLQINNNKNWYWLWRFFCFFFFFLVNVFKVHPPSSTVNVFTLLLRSLLITVWRIWPVFVLLVAVDNNKEQQQQQHNFNEILIKTILTTTTITTKYIMHRLLNDFYKRKRKK